MLLAFKSSIFSVATASSCCLESLPTLFCGFCEPFSRPSALRMRREAGGFLTIKVKERSLYTVRRTGTIEPIIDLVCVLNWLTNSPMLTPAGPSAVPTGGAGVALPASICNLIILVISFAIQLDALDLVGFELHRSLASEHRHEHFNLSALFVNLPYLPFKVLERPVDDDHRIALGKVDGVAHGVAGGALEDFLDFFRAKRNRLIGRAYEAGHLRRVAHHAPCVVARYHIDEDIAGEDFLACFGAAAILYLYLLLRRHDDVEYLFLHAEGFDALLQVACDRILVA